MNKKLTTIITLTLSLIMIITGISPVTTAFAEDNYKHEDIHDFIQEGQSVISQETITDFAGNTFKLYELSPSGYAIYSFNENASIFIEGSYVTNSPYYGESGTKYYCGIGEYFIEPVTRSANANVRHLRTDKSIPKTSLTGAAFTVDAEHYIKESSVQTRASNPSTPDPNKTATTSDGFTKIKNYNYLETLTVFPTNEFGTCGLVAACIILAYYDRFVDDDIITNSRYVTLDSNGKTLGATQSLHDYLFLECLHTILGITVKDNYPMGAWEIRQTMLDYINNNCSSSVQSRIAHYSPAINIVEGSKKYINGGNPVILTLVSYQYTTRSSDNSYFHNVVAFGYDSNNRFCVHSGWTTTPQIIISEYSLNSYYVLSHDWA